MKTLLFIFMLLCSTTGFGQKKIVGRVYSIVTDYPVSNTSIRLDDKQLIQADTNGIFEITTAKRKIKISVSPENIYQLDTLLFPNSTTDTVKLLIRYPIDSALTDYDIKHNQIQLFCGGGIAPLAANSTDKIFENKYLVRYHMLDCLMPDINELNSYNQRVALYLDKKYGLNWRQIARPDIFGVTKKAYR